MQFGFKYLLANAIEEGENMFFEMNGFQLQTGKTGFYGLYCLSMRID